MVGVEQKQDLLDNLDAVGAAMLRVNTFVVRLTPLGVFAISASAAGTMTVEEFARVQVFLFSYVAFTLVTAFCTPLPRYRFLSPSRSSTASRAPVEAPEGTAARPKLPSSNVTSASTVGLPRESRISRPRMSVILIMCRGRIPLPEKPFS